MTSSPGIVLAGLTPHPPIAIPEIGQKDAGRVSHTALAMTRLGKEIADQKPDTLVIIGPHGPVFRDAVAISGGKTLSGNLANFGAPSAKVSFENDLELAAAISRASEEAGVRCVVLGERESEQYGLKSGLDHGAVVPLHFLSEAGVDCRLVNITMGFLPYTQLYAFGTAIKKATGLLGRRIVVIASGDLSHRLTPDAPSGYDPKGKEFDAILMHAVRDGDPGELMNLDEDLIESAGECGLRPVIMMFGALDGKAIRSEILSYEGPFGVGYGVAVIHVLGDDLSRRFLQRWRDEYEESMMRIRKAESAHVRLARRALETFVLKSRRVDPQADEGVLCDQRSGCFCTLKKHGQLRGCIGTTGATTRDLAHEIIQNVVSAGVEDPRFEPVQAEELPDIVYSVDVLDPPEAIESPDALDPKTYGVIVERGARRGLLLPDLDGVDSVSKQIDIAKQKAGIQPSEQVKLYRFMVTRYH
jgi:MEMO1 family protein